MGTGLEIWDFPGGILRFGLGGRRGVGKGVDSFLLGRGLEFLNSTGGHLRIGLGGKGRVVIGGGKDAGWNDGWRDGGAPLLNALKTLLKYNGITVTCDTD